MAHYEDDDSGARVRKSSYGKCATSRHLAPPMSDQSSVVVPIAGWSQPNALEAADTLRTFVSDEAALLHRVGKTLL